MNLLLLSFGLGAVPATVPSGSHIGFVPTAGEVYDDPYFVRADRERLGTLGYRVSDIDISNSLESDIIEQLREIDALFVAGGNTFYLMQQIRKQSLFNAFRDFALSGRPYIGTSAGAAICGPSIQPIATFDDVDAAPELATQAGLGVFDYVILPHYGKPKYLDSYHAVMKEYVDQFRFVLLRDDEALRVSEPSRFELIPSPVLLDV